MNPILNRNFQIPFQQIKPEHIETGIREALAIANDELEQLTQTQESLDFENVLGALDALKEKLGHPIRLASHLMSVQDNPELRKGFESVQPEFSAFFARLPLNEKLWRLINSYSETENAKNLEPIQKRHLDKTMHHFIHAGANLPADKKQRAEEIKVELSQLCTKFSNNVLDSTNNFELVISEKDLVGLPVSMIQQAQESARAKGIKGYLFTLQVPSFLPFMKYSERRNIREFFYEAFANRACEEELDNQPLIERILVLRNELANLHGYKNFADYRLELNMVKNGQLASDFIQNLAAHTQPYFEKEKQLLKDFASSRLNIDLQPWDVSYVMEKLRKEKFDIDDEDLRPYFPLDNVLNGLFTLVKKIFALTITKQTGVELWHDSVEYYDINDEDGVYLGSFYVDLFPRQTKRAGAWMNYFYTGGPQTDGSFKPHLGLMCGNFTPPQQDKPALLTHREVETTFHEFGHLLHHMLSKVPIQARAGTNVAWDFVELPSQIMENWCWEREALDMFAKHYETGETIPEELFTKMVSARAFLGAYQQMRQLSFSTVDLSLHIDYNADKDGDAITYAQKLMEPFQIKPEFAHNHFLTAFTHIFAGSYAAGYYSYKWAEVLDADAFTRFKKEGILNREIGQAFVDAILSRGDSAEPTELFKEFMHREPDINALLKRTFGSEQIA